MTAMIHTLDLPAMVSRIAQPFIDARQTSVGHLSAEEAARLWAQKLKHIAAMMNDGRSSEAVLAESVAFDLAFLLFRNGVLPPPLYRLAGDVFGQDGLNDLIYIIGLQSMVARAVCAAGRETLR